MNYYEDDERRTACECAERQVRYVIILWKSRNETIFGVWGVRIVSGRRGMLFAECVEKVLIFGGEISHEKEGGPR